jgi:hypothetical protein
VKSYTSAIVGTIKRLYEVHGTTIKITSIHLCTFVGTVIV